jgi:hypothetical protein
MALNPSFSLNFTVRDRSGEAARFTWSTAAPIDQETLPTTISDWENSFAAICDGVLTNRNVVVAKKLSNTAYSADGQREEKWLVTYQDNVTLAVYQTELPCRKNSVKPPVNNDDVDLTVAPWVVFKTKTEAAFVSPDGNAITILKVTLVGRNN